LPCGAVRDIFNGLGAMKKHANNNKTVTRDTPLTPTSNVTLADINKRNRDLYGGKNV
jgi:hypothetical protein